MLLDDYIAREGCGYAGFGKRLDPPMSKGDVWNLAKGKRGVSMARGARVVAATKGKVSLEDLNAPFAREPRLNTRAERERSSA